jgi:hypothetical protein
METWRPQGYRCYDSRLSTKEAGRAVASVLYLLALLRGQQRERKLQCFLLPRLRCGGQNEKDWIMGIRLILLVFLLALRAIAQPQQQFNIQLLGVDPATNRIIIVNIDTRSMVVDRTSPANPTLACVVPGFQTGNGLLLDRRTSPPTLSALLSQISPPSVTYRATFAWIQSLNAWVAPAFFSLPPPNLTDLIQVHRNGALVTNDIASITYSPPAADAPIGTPGALSVATVSTWPATDSVTAVWVFPLQSLFLTPTVK